MMDVNYFLDQAQNSTQREFELDWADVIQVFDTNETELVTECGRTLIIKWDDNGCFKSYQVIYETQLMESSYNRMMIDDIINKLRTIDVDGETMQYILEKVGMKEQMFKQLVLSSEPEPLENLLSEWEEVYGEQLEF